MSKADEMFEKLGYKKEYNLQINDINYYKNYDNVIHFILGRKSFFKSGEFDGMHDYITMQELKAIIKKCKELRMDGEIEYGRHNIIDEQESRK